MSAREIVAVVASAAWRSRSTLPVCTLWLFSRNVSTSETVCAWAAVVPTNPSATASTTSRRLLIIPFLKLNRLRADQRALAHAIDRDADADGQVAARSLLAEIRVRIRHDGCAADDELHVRAAARQQQRQPFKVNFLRRLRRRRWDWRIGRSRPTRGSLAHREALTCNRDTASARLAGAVCSDRQRDIAA